MEISDFMNTFIIEYNIGYHVKKEKTLLKTIQKLIPNGPPYQMFIGNPQSSKMSIVEDELTLTKECTIEKNIKMYVHSQYIINLSNDDVYIASLLSKNLQYASAAGFRGVVVHVGKYTTRSLDVALENMYENMMKAEEYANEECPLLLETPAGQGTETLTTCNDFMNFMERFDDKLGKTIGICVDTCHVFASGTDPLEYIKEIYSRRSDVIKLVHFNDSKAACGSCVDRHEWIGEGKIGFNKMNEIAVFCKEHSIDMLYEG